jgi:hypothetical protein
MAEVFGDGPCQCAGLLSDDDASKRKRSIRENGDHNPNQLRGEDVDGEVDLGGQGRGFFSLTDWIGICASGAALPSPR